MTRVSPVHFPSVLRVRLSPYVVNAARTPRTVCRLVQRMMGAFPRRVASAGMCTIVFAFVCAAPVVADPIQITAQRGVHGFVSFEDADARVAHNTVGQGTSDLGSFAANVDVDADTALAGLTVTATQQSTIEADGRHLFGSGSVSISSRNPESISVIDASQGNSDVEVQFVLARPTAFHFDGTFFVSGEADDNLFAQAFIEGPSIDRPLDAFPIGRGVLSHVVRDGVLEAGTFNFLITANAPLFIPNTAGNATFQFDLRLSDVAATPEPASFVLMATGATLLARRRRMTAGTL